ncbi:MAG: hypothetical protein ABIT37_02635 [Luteolibacter sp.]
MKLPSSQFLRLVADLPTHLSSPALESMVLAWDHIAERYLRRVESNRTFAGRVRSIRLLAVHDAVLSIVDPGFGYIFKPDAVTRSTQAALAATAQAAHDILADAFDAPEDRADLGDLLAESLSLIGNAAERATGARIGAASAATYLETFSPLLAAAIPTQRQTVAA